MIESSRNSWQAAGKYRHKICIN